MHTKKKDCRPLPTARTPPIHSLATETHHTYACKYILMYAYGIPSTTKPVNRTSNCRNKKSTHTRKKRLQTTSNSTHSPNIFISNGNTPHICSQTHISACVCISVHYKVSQTAQLTAGVKNLTHTHKKRLQTTSNSTHSPHMHISIKITSLTCSRTHINACKCISVRHKSACQHPQRSKKIWSFWWQNRYT